MSKALSIDGCQVDSREVASLLGDVKRRFLWAGSAMHQGFRGAILRTFMFVGLVPRRRNVLIDSVEPLGGTLVAARLPALSSEKIRGTQSLSLAPR